MCVSFNVYLCVCKGAHHFFCRKVYIYIYINIIYNDVRVKCVALCLHVYCEMCV